ncbi:MAG: NAD(+)/NADH kinase, partial [Myxococcota bacterium]
KKSNFQIYVNEHKDPHISALEDGEPELFASLRRSHEQNACALAVVRRVLERRKWRSRWVYRARREVRRQVDLVIAVGGDGTLLEAARQIRDQTPLLGVNSSPSFSVGHLLTSNAEQFEETLDLWERGALDCHVLSRMQVSVDQRRVPVWALNDVLFCHPNPAATSRYEIAFEEQREQHRSSGIWVSTAAGSTAAMCSAGGSVMDWGDGRLQFRVRELYRNGEELALESGFVMPASTLACVSHMRKAYLYIDGPWTREVVHFGQEVVFSQAPQPLHLLMNGSRSKRCVWEADGLAG